MVAKVLRKYKLAEKRAKVEISNFVPESKSAKRGKSVNEFWELQAINLASFVLICNKFLVLESGFWGKQKNVIFFRTLKKFYILWLLLLFLLALT